jgi:hypothetical protein
VAASPRPAAEKSFQSARSKKFQLLGYNPSMFAAHPVYLTIASASSAGKAARATITKTTTIKG